LTLRPGEKLFLNGAVLVNGESRSELTLLNEVSILREKDIMVEGAADTPCKRIYFLLQLMYIDPSSRETYLNNLNVATAEIASAARSTLPLLNRIGEFVVLGDYYQAMKSAKMLISYEKELQEHVSQSN